MPAIRLFLLAVLAFLLVPFSHAATLPGSGTEADPYLISSYADLKAVRTMDLSKVYRLTADIDASASATENGEYGFSPIGNSSAPFSGVLHGGNFAIKGLTMGGNSSNRALIGYARGARLDSVRLVGLNSASQYGYQVGGLIGRGVRDTLLDCSVEGTIAGYGYLGGLAGELDSSVLRRCVTKVRVYGNSYGYSYGGLVGSLSRSRIDSCEASGQIRGSRSIGGLVGTGRSNRIRWSHSHGLVNATSNYGGGLMGESSYDTLLQSYATGSVSGAKQVGGLIGYGYGAVVQRCYAAARLSGEGSGGLIGYGYYDSVASSFAVGSSGQALSGGLVGSGVYRPKIADSYWDTTLTRTSGAGTGMGAGLSSAGMMNPGLLAGLGSFETEWRIRPDSTYPALRSVDNAPFAFPDTLLTGQSFDLKRLLENDFDIVSWRTGLAVRVDSLSAGTTDSLTQLAFPGAVGNFDTLSLLYRVGRIRTGDTLWGSQALSFLVANPRILARTVSVYQDSFSLVPAAQAVGGSALSYGLLQAPAHGTVLFRNDSLLYTPATGYVGIDSLRYFATDGTDTNAAWVKVVVTGPTLRTGRLELVQAQGGTVTDSVGPAPVAWKLTSPAAWLRISPDTGKGATAIVYSALSANTTGKPRSAVVTLKAGSTLQTLTVVQNSLQGLGTEASPFLLTNYADLKQVENHGLSRTYRLTRDIEASSSRTENAGAGFTPIGQDSLGFSGAFHGAGHLIKGLSIQHRNDGYYGLFRRARNATIDSLGLVDVRIVTDLTGYDLYSRPTTLVGAVAGQADSTSISQCYSSGVLSGGTYAGGLVGMASRHTQIRNSYSAATISGEGRSGYGGGLVGYLTDATLSNSLAVGALEHGARTMGAFAGHYHGAVSADGCAWDTAATGIQVAGAYGNNPFPGYNAGSSPGALSRSQMKDTVLLGSLLGGLAPVWTIRPDSTYPCLKALDNAPFAVADTFVTGQHFALSRLLGNDFDVETYRTKLVARVVTLQAGVTDSVKLLNLSKLARALDTVRVRYQVGEIRAADTLWGSVVTSLLRLDPRLVVDSFSTVTDSAVKVRAGTQISGLALSYKAVVPALHGTVSFAGDSLIYTPATGFAGRDSLLLQATNGTDTASGWVRMHVTGPSFVSKRLVLGNEAGLTDTAFLDRVPATWKLSSKSSWFAVTQGTGTQANRIVLTVLSVNATGAMRLDTLEFSNGTERRTLVVAQTTMAGAGTAASPYRIATLRDLKLLEATGLDKTYRLVADLNLAGNALASKDTALQPIGSEATPFTGRFHGAGHMLRGLSYPDWENGRGLFRATSHAVIDSLGLVDANFTGGYNGGALVATARSTRIEKVFVTGLVSVYRGGALVGAGDSILMRHCYSTAPIGYADAEAAGLVGILSHSRIESSWSMSIGQSSRNQALVWNTSNDTLVGCYWSKETGAQSSLNGVNGTVSDDTGLTLAQLKDPANLAGLGSFDTTWRIRPGITCPALRGFYAPPQGFSDSLVSGSTFTFARLLENDALADSGSKKPVFKLLNAGGTINWDNNGVTDTSVRTDSLTWVTYSPTGPWEDPTQWISYRPGEVIGNDTIWGDPVRSQVRINPFLFLRNLEVLTDSSVTDLMATEMNKAGITYTQLVQPLHGVASFRNDSLVYTPAKGFAGRDSLQVRGISGQDTSVKWVRILVKGARFGRRFALLQKASGSQDTLAVNEAPVAWTMVTKADWYTVSPAAGKGAGKVVFTASSANASSQSRLDTAFLNFGTFQDTLLVYQNGMAGAGTEADPYRIATYADLKLIEVLGMDKSYRIVADIDASPSRLENQGRGFKPLGMDLYDPEYDRMDNFEFKGRLHGGGHAITGLFMDQSKDTVLDYNANALGLFSRLKYAQVDSLALRDVSLTGAETIGALVAYMEDSSLVRAVSVTGTVKSYGYNYQSVGGLVGYMNRGRVVGCSMTGTVASLGRYGYGGVGGLVGYASGGTYVDSSRTDVTVLADSSSNVGGLVGYADDSIRSCSSRGLVRGGYGVGGLAGSSGRVIESSFSTAKVIGNSGGVGGLAGLANSVRNSYATGSVEGARQVGGLVGRNEESYAYDWMGFVQSYATGSVRGSDLAGGLVGEAGPLRVDTCYATGSVHSDTGLAGALAGSARTMRSSYAAGRVTGREGKVGGLVGDFGSYYGAIDGNLWDVQATGRSNGTATGTVGGMRGLSTEAMRDSMQVAKLGNFDAVWRIRQGATYPGLRSMDNAPFAFADTLRAGLSLESARIANLAEDIETGRQALLARIDSVLGGTRTASGIRFPTGAKLGDSLRALYRIGEARATDTLWGNQAWATVRLKAVAFVGLDSLVTYGNVFKVAAEIPGSGTVTFSAEGDALSLDGSTVAALKVGTATLVAASPGLDTVRRAVRIQPRTISVRADPRFKNFGDEDPVLTWSATGLVGKDSLTGSLVRAPGDTVGSYAITQGSLAAGGNYLLTFVPGILTIEPKPLGIERTRPRLTGSAPIEARIRRSLVPGAEGPGAGRLGLDASELEPRQTIDLMLSAPGRIEVQIADNLGTRVIASEFEVSKGLLGTYPETIDGRRILPLSWNLRSSNGVAVPDGVYLWKIVVRTREGVVFETVKKLGVHRMPAAP